MGGGVYGSFKDFRDVSKGLGDCILGFGVWGLGSGVWGLGLEV